VNSSLRRAYTDCVMPLPGHIKRHPATVKDLATLPEDVAAEVIDGELVEKAAPTLAHGEAQGELVARLRTHFRGPPGDGGRGGWVIAPEVEVEYEPRQAYRHDIVGWHRERAPKDPFERPVRIRPDWVCEVVSPSNASNDTVKKLRTLQRHGLPHYWLVEPERQTLTVLRWTAEGFLTVLTATGGEVVRAEPFEALELPVAALFGEGA
jgi:Uma2 family endonuclease